MRERCGEVVVITGATAGVGRAVVREFARRHACIGLLARDQGRLEATRREVEDIGGSALPISVDVADAAQVEMAAERVEQEFGPLDIWINNAMTTVFAPFTEVDPEEFKRATEVTYFGYVNGTRSALHRMLKRDCGTIVQVGSALGYRSIPLQSVYCGAKHAVIGFTDSIRSELIHRKSKVHITVVDLPAVNTPQFSWCRTRLPNHPQPVPPIFQPEVPARAIYWAAHRRRREVQVGFSTLKSIYGQNIAPGFADWYLGKTGYESQQTSQPVPPDRPDNLFQPVPGEHGAHGVFSDRSKTFSLQTWANLHRVPLGIAAGVAAVLGTLIWRKVSPY